MKIGKLHIWHLDRIIFSVLAAPFMVFIYYLTVISAYADGGIWLALFIGAFLGSMFWLVAPIAWDIFKSGWYYEN